MLIDSRLNRIDENRVRINNKQNINAFLFANEDVPIQQTAVDELAQFLEVGDTIGRVFESAPEYSVETPSVEQVAFTPDFHKAKGIPVGSVMVTSDL